MAADVSATRLYLGNLPTTANKDNVRALFETHGTGEITEVKVMSGFGFIEFADARDALDVVPSFHGRDFEGNRLTVQFARGNRPRDPHAPDRHGRNPPRRTIYQMIVTNLPAETSWQDLKDFARKAGVDVVFSETQKEQGLVEFQSNADLDKAVSQLDGVDFNETSQQAVNCRANILDAVPPQPHRARSRSPGGYRRPGYGPPVDYDRRGYSDAYRGGYRTRSPRGRYDDYAAPRRDDYYADPYRRAPPLPRYDDPYDRARPPYDDPYRTGHGRAPYPPRGRTPPPPGGPPAPRDPYYDDRRAW